LLLRVFSSIFAGILPVRILLFVRPQSEENMQPSCVAYIFCSCLRPSSAGIITFVYDEDGNLISQDPVVIDPSRTSTSWWFLFTARQLTTFALTVASEFIVIDYFCLRLQWINFFRSPFLTLLFVQSRGWPFRATTWGIYDLLMLQGDNPFSDHWMFYQHVLRVFNASNPRQATSREWTAPILLGIG
jgi:hypothetical protein